LAFNVPPPTFPPTVDADAVEDPEGLVVPAAPLVKLLLPLTLMAMGPECSTCCCCCGDVREDNVPEEGEAE